MSGGHRIRLSFGNTMQNLQPDTTKDHQVSITYGDGSHTFRLARGATLGELAVCVSDLDTLHASTPLTIDVKVETPRRPVQTPLVSHASH